MNSFGSLHKNYKVSKDYISYIVENRQIAFSTNLDVLHPYLVAPASSS